MLRLCRDDVLLLVLVEICHTLHPRGGRGSLLVDEDVLILQNTHLGCVLHVLHTLMARLLDSVAPDVKMISFGSAPIRSATWQHKHERL